MKVRIELGSVQETLLLLGLWSRAKESEKKKNPCLLDPKASEIIGRLDYDFGRIAQSFTEPIMLSFPALPPVTVTGP